jgi:hypothetical protein
VLVLVGLNDQPPARREGVDQGQGRFPAIDLDTTQQQRCLPDSSEPPSQCPSFCLETEFHPDKICNCVGGPLGAGPGVEMIDEITIADLFRLGIFDRTLREDHFITGREKPYKHQNSEAVSPVLSKDCSSLLRRPRLALARSQAKMLEHASFQLFKALGSPAWVGQAAASGWNMFVNEAEKVAVVSQPYAEKSAFLVPHMAPYLAKVDGFASTVGLDAVVVRFLCVMFLAYPLAFIQTRIPGTTLKHIYSLVIGAVAAQAVYGYQWAHPIIQAGVAYLLLLITAPFAGRLGIARPVLVFAWMLGYLAVQHLWRLRKLPNAL